MSEQKAIEAGISEFITAYDSGDVDSILRYYGDDLIKVRTGAAPETKSDLSRRVKEVFEKYDSQVKVCNEEIEVSGDIAFTRGSFRVSYTPKAGGETQVLERRYLEIWRKEQGRWVVVRAMDNME